MSAQATERTWAVLQRACVDPVRLGTFRDEWCQAMRELEPSDLERFVDGESLRDTCFTNQEATTAESRRHLDARRFTLIGAAMLSFSPFIPQDMLRITGFTGRDPLAGVTLTGKQVSVMQMALLCKHGYLVVRDLQEQLRLDGAGVTHAANGCLDLLPPSTKPTEEARRLVNFIATESGSMSVALLASYGARLDPSRWHGDHSLLVNMCLFAQQWKLADPSEHFAVTRSLFLHGVRALIDQGFLAAEKEGAPGALHVAARSADAGLVALLLQAGADPYRAGPDGMSAASIVEGFAAQPLSRSQQACQDVWHSFQAAGAARQALSACNDIGAHHGQQR